MTSSDPFKVLIADKIADEGIDLVRAVADVDIALNQSEDELCKKIENFRPGQILESIKKGVTTGGGPCFFLHN